LLHRVRERHEQLLQARIAKDYDLGAVDEPVLKAVLLAGRVASSAERAEAMQDAARKTYPQPYPTPGALAARAEPIDDALQRLFQLELMVGNQHGWALPEAERKPLEKTRGRLRGELAELLKEWEKFLYPEGRPHAAPSGNESAVKEGSQSKPGRKK
jgi:hypothetical protein